MSNDEERRRAIQKRLDALRIGDREWERLTGIPRQTVNRTLAGTAKTQQTTFNAIESALDKIEATIHGEPTATVTPLPDPQVVTFRVSGDFGVDVAVSGPVENIDELRETVEKLIRGMHPRQN